MVLNITYAKPKDLRLSLWDAGDAGKEREDVICGRCL